jgi:iron complex transport system substrate-binding protein
MRIVSLLPAATDVVVALGLTEQLVGRSFECTGPDPVAELPAVTVDLLAGATSSADIDAAVRAAAAAGTGTSQVDLGLLARLAPDVILTQDLCDVCAVPAASLTGLGVPLVRSQPHTLAEVADTVVRIARALGVEARGREVAEEMRARIDAVRHRVAGRAPRRVVLVEWLDPPFTAGHWIPEMIAAAGGVELLGTAGARSVPTTWDAVRAARPELVVLAPCGFDEARTETEFAAVGVELACPTVVIDADRLTARPSPLLAAGVERLAELFHG